MKNVRLFSVLLIGSFLGMNAQKNNVQNAYNYMNRNELDMAKAAIDAAAEHEDTRNNAKMFLYRAETYLKIVETKDEKFKNLDPDAAEKAYLAAVNCLKKDQDKVFYDDAKVQLSSSAYYVLHKSYDAANNKQFDKAMHYVQILFDCLPFEYDGVLKRENITKEQLNAYMVSFSLSAGNNAVAKEYIQKLIDLKYKDANLYLEMAEIFRLEGNFEKQLSYIEQGRAAFDDNKDLIAAEIGYYIKQNKVDQLLEKVNKAIEQGTEDEVLYFIQGKIYQDKKDLEKAEQSYKKAIDKKPDYEGANYNLGYILMGQGFELSNQANDLPPNQGQKAKQLDEKAKGFYTKALPYLEKAHEIDSNDQDAGKALMKLYTILGETEKCAKLKEEMAKPKDQPKAAK